MSSKWAGGVWYRMIGGVASMESDGSSGLAALRENDIGCVLPLLMGGVPLWMGLVLCGGVWM